MAKTTEQPQTEQTVVDELVVDTHAPVVAATPLTEGVTPEPSPELTAAVADALAAPTEPEAPVETQAEPTPELEDASATAVVYDTPEPTMVNGVFVGATAAKPEPSLYDQLAAAFPNERQITPLLELCNRVLELECRYNGLAAELERLTGNGADK